jgi:hypothetical protein
VWVVNLVPRLFPLVEERISFLNKREEPGNDVGGLSEQVLNRESIL